MLWLFCCVDRNHKLFFGRDLQTVADLTQILKLTNIPVAILDEGCEKSVVEKKSSVFSDHQYSTSQPQAELQPDFNEISPSGQLLGDTDKTLVRHCVLCDKKVLGRHAYGRHMKAVHPIGPFLCPIQDCGKRQESGLKMLAHMYSHNGPRGAAMAEGKKFGCTYCDASYTTLSRLNGHLRTKHAIKAENRYNCNSEGCAESFPTAAKFTSHMLDVHQLNPWLCDVCGKRHKDKQNYRLHQMTDHQSKSFACDICQKEYKNPRRLYVHRALHSGRRFLCPHCGYSANSAPNLRGHIMAKHLEKNHKCSICYKEFSSLKHLQLHFKTHGSKVSRLDVESLTTESKNM